MKRNVLVLTLLTVLSIPLFAGIVPLDLARTVAVNAFSDKAMRYLGFSGQNHLLISSEFTVTDEGEEMYYIFNFLNTGHILISAEDAMVPVLGYSLGGEYSALNPAPNYLWLMEDYKNNIRWLRRNSIPQEKDIAEQWDRWTLYAGFVPSDNAKDVEPLLTSAWNQDWPYNYYCPQDPSGPGGRTYVGCVATAMAQNMYYWRWPDQGVGDVCYTPSQNPQYGEQCANFGDTHYNWDGMLDNSDTRVNLPMAEIGYHCAVAVHMEFSPNGSGAYSTWVPFAIKSYFKYSSSAAYVERNTTAWTTWKNYILDELNESRPVYYSGYEPGGGGHAWNCDGYHSADDMFHFNFGWSGFSNGWYTIQNPGGFTSGHGYVKNFYPDDPSYPPHCQGTKELANIVGTFEDGSGPQENYENNITCSYLINPQTQFDSVTSITLSFIVLDTESNNDVITIYDGESTGDSVLATISGQTLPSPVTSTGNKMLLVFETNGSVTASGWKAGYESTQPVWCTGLTTLTSTLGSFDDGSGVFNYKNNSNCMWKLDPLYASDVTLTFTGFDTEEGRDIVKVYDASNNQLLATLSGNYLPGNMPPPITSPSGKIFLTFQTDGAVTYGGWEAEWTVGNVGVDEAKNDNNSFEVFPNPAEDFINISFVSGQPQNLKVTVFSITGKILYEEIRDDFRGHYLNRISTSSFAPGIYFISIDTGKEKLHKKVAVQ
ncbi:MAG: C10 family peptidase [Bacteroidales bacterium]|nr:C10 family peptidase [Bacteroidales bacterium]